MRNLKKVLALALVFALALGMMATAAFTDVEDIDMSDAVNTMTALGIINGYTDGSFRPDGIVTRAEMAKMIYVLKNGGKDDGASYYKNLSTPLTDISGHWAEGYIKYCYTLGIIAGMGDGTFRPQENVTGLQAAKMILTVLGYDAEKSGLVGLTWGVNTAALGAEKMLFEDFETALDQGLPRQEAALLMYNGLDASVVKWDGEQYVVDTRIQSYSVQNDVYSKDTDPDSDTYGEYIKSGYTTDTMTRTIEVDLGYSLLKLDRTTGIMYAVGEAATAQNESVAEDAFRVGGTTYTEWEGDDLTKLVGCEVEVLFKDTDKVFGVFATEKNTVVNATYSKISKSDEKVKFSGTTYKLDSDFTVVSDYGQTGASVKATSAYFDEAKYADEVILVDNDNDGKLDYAFRNKVALGKVTYKGSDSVTITDEAGLGALTELRSFDLDDDIIGADDLARDDYVKLTMDARTGKIVAEKADKVSGTISATRSTSAKIGDNWYNYVAGTTPSGSSGDDVDYIVFGDIFYYIDAAAGISDVSELLMLINIKEVESVASNGFEGYIINHEGVKSTVKLADDVAIDGDGTLAANKTDDRLKGLVGKIYSYEINNDDEYELKLVTEKGDFDHFGADATYNPNTDEMGGYEVYDDATVFVFRKGTADDTAAEATGNNAKVITGKALNRIGAIVNKMDGQYLTDKVDGFEYAVVLSIGTTNYDFTSDTDKYAYLTADTSKVEENGKKYFEYTIWDGTAERVVREENSGSSVAGLKKGAVITYNEAGSMIDDVAVIATADQIKASTGASAITGYTTDGKKIQLVRQNGEASGTTTYSKKIDSDTVIIYINTKDKKGVEGGAITLASKDKDGHYMANAYVAASELASANENLAYIFVEAAGSAIDGWTCGLAHTGTYEITFNAQEGAAVEKQSTNADGNLASLPTTTREGYIFKEWNTKNDGTGTKVTTSYDFTAATTVYAIWVQE